MTLLLFDRVGVGLVGPALHYDVRSLRYRRHFNQIGFARFTADHLVAERSSTLAGGRRCQLKSRRKRSWTAKSRHEGLREVSSGLPSLPPGARRQADAGVELRRRVNP